MDRLQNDSLDTYTDFSRVPDTATLADIIQSKPTLGLSRIPKNYSSEQGNKKRGPGHNFVFPTKLFVMLSHQHISHIIKWLPHGRSWLILNKTEFEKILPRYFNHSNYSSFIRQVNGWGFKRMSKPPDHNSYYHELFLRRTKHLIQFMIRHSSREKSITTEPQFSNFPLLPLEKNRSMQEEHSVLSYHSSLPSELDVLPNHSNLSYGENSPKVQNFSSRTMVQAYPPVRNIGHLPCPPLHHSSERWNHNILPNPHNQMHISSSPRPPDQQYYRQPSEDEQKSDTVSSDNNVLPPAKEHPQRHFPPYLESSRKQIASYFSQPYPEQRSIFHEDVGHQKSYAHFSELSSKNWANKSPPNVDRRQVLPPSEHVFPPIHTVENNVHIERLISSEEVDHNRNKKKTRACLTVDEDVSLDRGEALKCSYIPALSAPQRGACGPYNEHYLPVLSTKPGNEYNRHQLHPKSDPDFSDIQPFPFRETETLSSLGEELLQFGCFFSEGNSEA